jgi:uncharacterized protein YeaO (DUF488 family)
MTEAPQISVRRVYEPATEADGARVLVDRVWPRGLSKDQAAVEEWCKEVAPSTELRKWYGHDPDRFTEFRARYLAELDDPQRATALSHLREVAHKRPLTLLTGTKDIEISQAAVLAEVLRGHSHTVL